MTVSSSSSSDVPLIVDLDGTLCRTDTLHEAILKMAATKPQAVFRVSIWLGSEDRAGFKARVADEGIIDPEQLPLNEAVLDLVRQARQSGRRTALVSASDHRQVTAVAEATGLFDEAHGSTKDTNLKGETKAAFLTERYGEKGFDYVGDSRADVPVWTAARSAVTVGASNAIRSIAEQANENVDHIDPPTGRWASILRAMRPHQWSKNVLIFLPLIASHDFAPLPAVLLGFVAFCLAASAVYVINDLIDLPSDRAHPRKRHRPFASGALSATDGLIMATILFVVALVLGMMTGKLGFLAVLAVYLVATFAYSIWLKRGLLVDVLTLAGLYTIRIVAGGAAAGVDLSPWLLGFSGFIFMALASVKRQAELMDQKKTGRASAGRAYETEDLPILRGIAISAGQAAVLVLALYISSDAVISLYRFPSLLWFVCPLILYWMMRMVMKTHRGQMTDDPIVFAARDRVSLMVLAMSALIAVMASVWPWYVPQI